jgi:hypothetical protein
MPLLIDFVNFMIKVYFFLIYQRVGSIEVNEDGNGSETRESTNTEKIDDLSNGKLLNEF